MEVRQGGTDAPISPKTRATASRLRLRCLWFDADRLPHSRGSLKAGEGSCRSAGQYKDKGCRSTWVKGYRGPRAGAARLVEGTRWPKSAALMAVSASGLGVGLGVRFGIEEWVVGVALGAVAVEEFGPRVVERGAALEAVGEIGVGDEEFAEGDGIG